MGEAKRRKKLDPNWGKGKTRLDRIADRLIEAEIANEEWQNPDLAKPIELPGLSKHQTESLNKVCKTLSGFVLQDPNHSLSAERSPFMGENETATIEAGKTLNEIGGISLMIQVAKMIVPPCDQRELDYVWHGIGEWKA